MKQKIERSITGVLEKDECICLPGSKMPEQQDLDQ